MSQPIRLVLADDHQLFLDGLHALLQQIETVEVVATANNGQQLLRKMETLPRVHVAVLDRHMPLMDGIETTQALRSLYPGIRVLGLSMSSDLDSIKGMLDAGASGYILKNTDKAELAVALEKVADGEFYLSQEVNAQLAQEFLHTRKQRDACPQRSENVLTLREKEILVMIARELSNPQIADRLFISSKTVETHRKNLMRKIAAKSRLGVYKYAVQHRMV